MQRNSKCNFTVSLITNIITEENSWMEPMKIHIKVPDDDKLYFAVLPLLHVSHDSRRPCSWNNMNCRSFPLNLLICFI